VKPDSNSVEVPHVAFSFPQKSFWKNPSGQSQLVTWRLSVTLGSLPLAGCGGWHHVKCVRERERETLIECLWQTDISKAQKAEFLLQQDFSCIWNGKLWLRHLLTDWMAKCNKRAYESFVSNLEDLYSPAATSYLGLYQCSPHPTNTANYSLIPPTQEHEKYIYEGR
jgi:hypothetical protein